MAISSERVADSVQSFIFPAAEAKPHRESVRMAQMTMIARVVDGLPLVGTMQDDEQVSNFESFR